MRARLPDVTGMTDHDGVGISYEVHGHGDATLLLIPPSPITYSRIFKAQVPYLARHFRVVTFDGRGNGRSDRPVNVSAHRRQDNIGDLLAVLDATDTESAVLVAHCHANWWAVEFASENRQRVRGLVAIAPGVPFIGKSQPHWVSTAPHWEETLDDPQGWDLYNRNLIINDHHRWIEWFFGQQLVEPHSTKQYEDAVGWALESTGEVLVAGEEGIEGDPPTRKTFEETCRAIDYPVLVIHGERDVCQRVDRGRSFAEIANADLTVIDGGGHLGLARDPVKVNLAIKRFGDRIRGVPMESHVWTRGLERRKQVLYLSSPIGLGHAQRDLAIATELWRTHPEVDIHWLAQDPVSTVLRAKGEKIHPASEWLASESGHIASEAAGHELHCFQALRRMDEILVANFMIFQEVVEETAYDLVIGDEAWDIDYYWHENPELKRGAHVWLTDFVGYLPMPSGGEHEAYLTADYNAEMIEHIARFPRIRDRAIFVGNGDDIVPDVFGPDLPKIRDWTEAHFDFSGYITGFTPPTPDETKQWRAEFGYGDEEKVCIVTVGGSGVGRHLLDLAIAAFPMARQAIPELRMIVVAGPRIDERQLPEHPGLEVRGYVKDLYRHLSVCDLAVVQGGLTTTMELTAAKRPFIYFPLINHFEQTYHVRHRLDQYGAGLHMDYATTNPDSLAAAIAAEIGRPVRYSDVETQGAATAAGLIADLI